MMCSVCIVHVMCRPCDLIESWAGERHSAVEGFALCGAFLLKFGRQLRTKDFKILLAGIRGGIFGCVRHGDEVQHGQGSVARQRVLIPHSKPGWEPGDCKQLELREEAKSPFSGT